MKDKYKLLVDTYFDKDTKKTYTKGSTIELTQDKAERLLKMKCVEKTKEKNKTSKEESNENIK